MDGHVTSDPLTVSIWVDSTEAQLVLPHGLLEVLLCLLHDPALHLLGADTVVFVKVHPGGQRSSLFKQARSILSNRYLKSFLGWRAGKHQSQSKSVVSGCEWL